MKTPRGADELLLYLDYDGVLHHENVLWYPRKGAVLEPAKATMCEHAHADHRRNRPSSRAKGRRRPIRGGMTSNAGGISTLRLLAHHQHWQVGMRQNGLGDTAEHQFF